MTYNEKKSLYESIMKDVSKIIKQKLNEEASDRALLNLASLSERIVNYIVNLRKTNKEAADDLHHAINEVSKNSKMQQVFFN